MPAEGRLPPARKLLSYQKGTVIIMTEHTHLKRRLLCAAAALTLMVIPASCGARNKAGMNENGIYDGSNRNDSLIDRAGRVVDDAGDAVERGADRVASTFDDMDGVDSNTTGTTTTTTSGIMEEMEDGTTTTATTRTAAAKR